MTVLLTEKRHAEYENTRIDVGLSENIVKVYPGEEVYLKTSVSKPTGMRVRVSVKGVPSAIVRITVIPDENKAPFTANVVIRVHENALPGVYFPELVFTRLDTGFSTSRTLVLVVLPKQKSQRVADEQAMVEIGRELYKTIGPTLTIYWYLLNLLLHGVSLVEFQRVYEFHRSIAGISSKNATLKALKRLEFYGLVEKVGHGVYRLLPVPLTVALNAIDRSRVRTREQVLRSRNERESEKGTDVRLPRVVTRVLDKARELAKAGSLWKAVDLLAHTVLPVRETDVLLAWVKDMFIYFENKDSKVHILRSPRLAAIFRSLGIPEGDMTSHRFSDSGDIVRAMFRSHDNARRVHYLLKELGWFIPITTRCYFYEIRYYPRPVLAVYALNENGVKETLYEVSLSHIPPWMSKTGPIVPTEHVKPEDEETYFHRTRG